MDYANSKMCRLSSIAFYFFQNGRAVPESMTFVGGRIVGDPRSNSKYWVIGRNDLFEIQGEEAVIARYDSDVVSMIETFA